MKAPACLLVATGFLWSAVPAWALDEYAATGKIVSLEILQTTADAYANRHGSTVVKSAEGEQEYRWGGTSCSGKTLTPEQVATLVEAHAKKLKISILGTDGAGDIICIVGFRLGK